jgi:ABC-2 type transport system ATP-binding protein
MPDQEASPTGQQSPTGTLRQSSGDGGSKRGRGEGSPVISLRDVGVEFSRGHRDLSLRDLVFHISFEVSPGEAVGVIGRNGQGKSTLLKIVAGVLLPDEGDVRVEQGVAPLIEMKGGFAGDLTGRENIYLAAGLHGMTKAQIDEKFDSIVDFAEIRQFLDTQFRHYSSGMQVRLAFAVISQLEEPIILVDEVLAVGDKAFKDKCYNRIDEMLDQGRTLFLVSHSNKDLKRFCSRGLYLRKGELIEDGPLNDVLRRYVKEG